MFDNAIKKYYYILFISLLAVSIAAPVFAAGGFPDKQFAGNGKSVLALPNSSEKAADAAVQPDGKIVVVGSILVAGGAGFDMLIVRYNENGTIDTTFADQGQKIISVNSMSDHATSVAIQADGKIVVAGSSQSFTSVTDFTVIRLSSGGQLDSTFGLGGIKLVAPTANGNGAMGMALQTIDGQEKIVVAGYGQGQSQPVMAFVRLNSNGELDPNFGTGGIATISSTSAMEYAYDVAIQNGGGENKIVGAGYSRFNLGGGSYRDDFAVVRLLSNGTPDAGFGTVGKVRTQMAGTSGARGVVIQRVDQTEKIVAGGYTFRAGANDFSLARYNADGALDTTFGTQGRAYLDIAGNKEDQIQDLLIQPDGKMIGVGWTRTAFSAPGQDFALARFNADGSLDKSFGACGKVVTDLGSDTDIAYGGALAPDGRVIAVGEFQATPSSADISIARYGITGGGASALSSDFDGDAREDISVFRPSNGTWYMNCSCEGTTKAVQFGAAGDVPVAADYDGDGYTDPAVFRNGVWYISRSSDGGVGVIQFGSEGDVPTVGDYDGDGIADVSVWRASTGVWYVINSSNGEYRVQNFGAEGDKPVQGDYDHDNKTDLAVYRAGTWWIARSSEPGGNYYAYQFGNATDIPVKGDFDGDRKADMVVYRPAEGIWYQQLSHDGYKWVRLGALADVPVAADYTGDGKAEAAVFRNGGWYIQTNASGAYSVTNFGAGGDLPTVLK